MLQLGPSPKFRVSLKIIIPSSCVCKFFSGRMWVWIKLDNQVCGCLSQGAPGSVGSGLNLCGGWSGDSGCNGLTWLAWKEVHALESLLINIRQFPFDSAPFGLFVDLQVKEKSASCNFSNILWFFSCFWHENFGICFTFSQTWFA